MKDRLKFLFFVAALVLFWFFGRFFPVDTEAIQKSLAQFPHFYSGVIFVLLYVVVSFFLWFSKDVFRFAAAVLFGAFLSTLFIWIAEIINTGILFHFSRGLGRNFVENSLKGKYRNLDQKLAGLNFFWLFMFRLVPLVPFRFLDLAMGLSKISFRRYFTAAILGSPLRIFWVQFVLAGVGRNFFKSPSLVAEFFLKNQNLFFLSILYLILMLIVGFKLKA